MPEGKATSEAIAWSRTGRGSYMPTPLIYNGILYVLANNGLLDAYNLRDRRRDLSSEIAAGRQRLQRIAGSRRR